jgi:S-formylglutathione hydrolase FrmB
VLRAAVMLIFLALAAPASAAPDDLTVTRHDQLSPRMQEYGFTTAALTGETNVRVLVPEHYAAHPRRRYPVLYLLHGCCDFDVPGSRAWTVHGEAEKATAGLDLIVVMPDGGRGGFYSDWYRNGLGGPPMWETYHLSQLLPWVDREFRTRANRRGRVVAGLSMGGFGAMKYAAIHPDWFVAAATFSGAVDTNAVGDTAEALSALDGGGPGSVWGIRSLNETRWHGDNPTDLAENLRGLQLTLRTGNGEPGPYDDPNSGTDPIESAVHTATLNLHAALDRLKIRHVFEDYGGGHHAWPYWARDLVRTLPDLMATLEHPPALPRRVTYRSVDPAYDVYGWSVERKGSDPAFSRLSRAGLRGFTFAADTDAVVTTPRRFPGPRLHVPVKATGKPVHVTLRCRKTCRVTS